MKVLFISPLFGDKYTGPTVSVPNQINTLSKVCDVCWINYSKNSTIIPEGYIKPVQVSTVKEFKKAFRNFGKIDFIVFEELFALQYSKIINYIIKTKIPYSIVPRCQITSDYMKHKSFKKLLAYKLIYKRMLTHSSFIQFLTTEEQKESFEYTKGINYRIIPNGINLPENSNYTKELSNKKECVFIGRLAINHKGLDLLLEAIGREKEELLNANFHFSIYGPDDRTGNAKELNDLIECFGISKLVSLGGPVFESSKEEVLRNGQFFICSSRYEGLPMSVLEALSYKLPCVATVGSNLSDKIKDFKCGYACETSVNGLVNAFKQMINTNEKQYQELSNRAFDLAKYYSWENATNLLINDIKKVITGE